MYDSTNRNIKKLKQVDIPVKVNFGAGVIQNNLLMIGGFVKSTLKTLNTVYLHFLYLKIKFINNSIQLTNRQVDSIDLTTGKLSTFEPMQEARQCHGVVALGDGLGAIVYAIGGKNGKNFLNSVERLSSVLFHLYCEYTQN